jgi:high-affinity nickel-transport protein
MRLTMFNDKADHMRNKIYAIYAVLIVANLAAWAWALIAFHDHPVLLGTAFLAYSFGLRHAFDADHIAAIDNVTRKLMQEGKRPVSIGFFFSLGHSVMVVVLTVALVLMTAALQARFAAYKDVGSIVGTSVSALFLFAIAAANIVVLLQVYRAFRSVKQGGRLAADDIDQILLGRGLLGRIFRPVFRVIGRSWHMFGLGILFGLGFDTATEVGLLGISATQATQGMSLWSILVFPALFAAGMSLMDTTDSILMVGAYGWAFVKPIRKLYYNMTITFVSVVAALAVGGIEAFALIGDKFGLEGGFWAFTGALSDNFGFLGYGIVAFFVLSWLVSFIFYKVKGYDRLEVSA